MNKESLTFDPAAPDLKLVKQVLYQAFSGGTQLGAIDVWGEAWSFRGMDLGEWRKLEKFMLDNDLIYEPGQPGFHSLTEKGREFESTGKMPTDDD